MEFSSNSPVEFPLFYFVFTRFSTKLKPREKKKIQKLKSEEKKRNKNHGDFVDSDVDKIAKTMDSIKIISI